MRCNGLDKQQTKFLFKLFLNFHYYFFPFSPPHLGKSHWASFNYHKIALLNFHTWLISTKWERMKEKSEDDDGNELKNCNPFRLKRAIEIIIIELQSLFHPLFTLPFIRLSLRSADGLCFFYNLNNGMDEWVVELKSIWKSKLCCHSVDFYTRANWLAF